MKIFIDYKEEFIIQIPDDWYFTAECHNGDVSKQPFSFESYEEKNAAYQISYFENNARKKLDIEPQPKGESNLKFIESKADGMISWMTAIQGGGIIVITYIYDSLINSKQNNDNFKNAEDSIKSLLILTEETREYIVPRIRWDKFMVSYAASIDLVNRAFENGAHLELVLLLANKIDAVLRQSIILTKQLNEKSDIIDVKLIYQKETDKPIMEKTVYQMALNQKIIDKETHDELVRLYNIRNQVVHRFIISDIRTDDIIQLVWSYNEIHDKIGKILMILEKEQFKEQIGIYKGKVPPDVEISDELTLTLIAKIKDKHGNNKVNEEISIKKTVTNNL